MKKRLLVILSLLLLCASSCKVDSVAEQRKEHNSSMIKILEFRKHGASGLCFAVGHMHYSGYLAHVPCNLVEHLLKKKD